MLLLVEIESPFKELVMFLCSATISSLCTSDKPMITSFLNREIREPGIPSYGLTSEGYDVRAKPNGWLKCNKNFSGPYNISKPDPDAFIEFDADKNGFVTVPAHSMIMGRTENGFNLPPDVMMMIFTKSSFARGCISLNTTKAVPSWSGDDLVLEFTNSASFPVCFDVRGGVASMVFALMDGQSKKYIGNFSKDQPFLSGHNTKP